MNTPDTHANGLTTAELDPLRYDGHTDDPYEVAGLLRSFMPEGARVLDVGCGTGSVSTIVNRGKGNEVHGIEPDPRRAEVARSRGMDVFCGYLTEDYFANHGQFDVVVFADVLEHLPDPAGMLALAASGLRSGGLVLISVPNVAHWSIRLDLIRGRFDYTDCGIRDATHLRWFTRKTLEHLLHTQDLEILELKQSAGIGLYDYWWRRPWKWMPIRMREEFVHAFTRSMPLLFGCQHIVKARKR
jgi:methionine biosynthesis protein MetW